MTRKPNGFKPKLTKKDRPSFAYGMICQCKNCSGWRDSRDLADEICIDCAEINDNEEIIGYRKGE